MKIKFRKNNQAGYTIVYLLVIIFIFSVMMFPIIDALTIRLRVIRSGIDKEQALQIADAGINYYQWRLAHFPTDYQDGTGEAGPYLHDYIDFDTQETVGQFSLEITPPEIGSTIVTIESTGWTNHNPNVKRTVTVRYGVPSLAKYSFLSNAVVWIGDTESVTGEMQSNNGIRFDGTGNAPIQSAKETYTCSSGQGSPCPTTQNGVWGSATQAVKNFWQFPVPAVDFSSLTADLADMKNLAEDAGIYLPPSNKKGYSLVFNADGTVSVYKVTSVSAHATGRDVNGVYHSEDINYNNRDLQFTQNIPDNGIIYIEDKTWVEGIVNGKAMVTAAILPYSASIAPTIYIPNNITYLEKDGTHTLGLLAQKDLVITYGAPTDLEINAALIAQNGSTQFFYYPGNIKNSITVYGSIMTYGQWTWSWVDSSGAVTSGYQNTNSVYDKNLLFSPPPSFPLSSSGYQQIDWRSN
ncbi:MAG: hypothetical protein WC027_03100 [Candidatus Paceibacterota bacterium]